MLFNILQRFLVGTWGGGDLTPGIAAVLLILILPRGIAGWLDDLHSAAAARKPGGAVNRHDRSARFAPIHRQASGYRRA
ncbi:MAG: hypothetical protein JJU19_05990 [Pararhodobacter sp.]|nr:hypothetical protein [Pararhodobacter sp.]